MDKKEVRVVKKEVNRVTVRGSVAETGRGVKDAEGEEEEEVGVVDREIEMIDIQFLNLLFNGKNYRSINLNYRNIGSVLKFKMLTMV